MDIATPPSDPHQPGSAPAGGAPSGGEPSGGEPTTSLVLTICICTMDRPEVLRRCLQSIADGSSQAVAVLVSDDSRAGEPTQTVCAAYPWVRYLRGPRTGLCANRNQVIRQATTRYISLLDDDAVVSADFVQRATALIPSLPPEAIVTGTVIETDHPVVPGNPSFWGHFGAPPRRRFENINLNCNLFPRAAFDQASFDETIAYGYEDMDVCSCLLAQGFSIRHDPTLVNTHLPPAKSASTEHQRFLNGERARFYTSVKRYWMWERNIPKLAAYLLLAPLHRAAYAVKTRRWFDLPHCLPDMVFALRATQQARARQQAVPGAASPASRP